MTHWNQDSKKVTAEGGSEANKMKLDRYVTQMMGVYICKYRYAYMCVYMYVFFHTWKN